jgi:hypothetical protein
MNAYSDFLSLATLRPLANNVRELASAVDHPDGARWLRELAAELEDHADEGARLAGIAQLHWGGGAKAQ